jgi:nitrite reductase/ring-hydroxylating ferredoxin subunit
VVATNTPFHLRVPVHTKQAPYRTYAIAAAVPKGAVPDILVWDTEEPGYHYVRLQPGEDEDLLIVGGEDHKSGTSDDGAERVARLEAGMRARWPEAGDVRYAWSGQVYEPADYVGFIGASPEHHWVYLVTGDSGQGMTTGALSGLILRDLLEGRPNPWAELYDPSRLMHRSLGEYVKENLEAAKHWIELVSAREVASVDDIAPGEGALVRLHGKPVAAHRDETGELTLRSAVCTHAGCVVHWNGFERCWDCPCHGSQFSPDGEVLNGPAAKPLAAVDDSAAQPAARTGRTGGESRPAS